MATASGFARTVEEDLSRGMFPSLAPERIPKGGAFDITNGLLDEQNVVYRRGGTTYRCQTPLGEPRMLWNGFLKHGGIQTLMAAGSFLYRILPSGTAEAVGIGTAALTRAQVFEGVLYMPNRNTYNGEGKVELAENVPSALYFAVAGGRLLTGNGSRVSFCGVPKKEGEALVFAETDFHQLPGGVEIVGMQGLRTSCVVFTTEGIWVIGGLEKELTDAEGNIQQTLDVYSAQSVLWGNNGVAGWSGGLVVPCKDNIFLMELGVSSERAQPFVSISGAIQNVYRGYVAAGYKPGVAAVYRGHYFLPILSGANVVDMLVCRLDATDGRGRRTSPWSHLKGSGALLPALAVTDEETAFLGATAGVGRVLSLDYFEPSVAVENDADGSAIPFEITTRSIPTGSLNPNTIAKARLLYRLVAGPGTTIELAIVNSAYGAEWDEFNWDEGEWAEAFGPFSSLGASIPLAKADPEAQVPKIWPVGRKLRYARMKITLNGPASEASIRALELFVRSDGRII